MLTWFAFGFITGAALPAFAAWLVFQRNRHLRKRVRYWIDRADDARTYKEQGGTSRYD